MPRYYLQKPDGGMINVMEYTQQADGSMTYVKDSGNGCAVYVCRMLMLTTLDVQNTRRLIDGVHGTVTSSVRALLAAGWQDVNIQEPPRPGDIIVWEKQQQADGEHVHIGFSLGNNEAISTQFMRMNIGRHSVTYDGSRRIERLLRYPWPAEEYDALVHLDLADGSAR